MTKLSDAQHELLNAAASAETGIEADTPAKAAIAALIKRGFLISIPRAEGPSRLLITEKGRAAMTPEPEPAASDQERAPPAAPGAPTPEPRTTKIGTLVKLLCRRDGATIAQMMEATGWQAHSVRGALSGAVKKDLGLNVASEKIGDQRVYRIVAETQA